MKHWHANSTSVFVIQQVNIQKETMNICKETMTIHKEIMNTHNETMTIHFSFRIADLTPIINIQNKK